MADIPDVNIGEESPTDHRISWWFENTFVRVAKRVFNALSSRFRQVISFSLGEWIEDIEQGLIIQSAPLLDFILTIPDLPQYIRQPIIDAREGTQQASAIIIGACVFLIKDVLLQSMVIPMAAKIRQGVSATVRENLLSVGDVLELTRRQHVGVERFNETLIRQGFTDDDVAALGKIIIPRLDLPTIMTSMFRGDLVGNEFVDAMKEYGFTAGQISMIVKSQTVIPSVGDLVSMSVREAFDDEVAATFGYDENFPTEAAEWGEKQGLHRDWMERYWRAHWTLPGISQAFEMYQRKIIKEHILDLYLRAADIPIFWREALKKMAYRVITRVDVRRIYDLGIFDEYEVYGHYREMGYSITDATSLTQWTMAEYGEEQRAATKSEILKMYRESILNPIEMTTYLEALGYPPDIISLYQATEDLKRAEAHEKEIIKNVHDLYLQGIYNRTDVHEQLGKLAPPAAFVEEKLSVWDLEKRRRIKKPSLTQLRDMWLDDVISELELGAEMLNEGYSIKYIGWLKKLWKG